MKEKLIVIAGPTAVGKTALSIRLSKKYNGEVISGDSMQIYKGMDIGTAKVTEEEKAGVPHHLIDIKNPIESFSVAEFQSLVTPLITKMNEEGHIPILTGGTGLYINSVIKGYELGEMVGDESYRLELEELVKEIGKEKLHEKLKEIDHEAATNIHPNNVRRVIRALEVYKVTNMPFSQFQRAEQVKYKDLYDIAFIGLTMKREKLYDRINRRVQLMIEEGLVDEVKKLYDAGIKDCQSVQAIGYKELYDYFNGRYSIDEAVEQIKQNSRRYAKRQLTWFRNKSNATWFQMDEGLTDDIFAEICEYIDEQLKM